MRKSSLAGYLDVQLSNEDVTKPKPDPEMFTKAIEMLGLTPHDVLILEDNENGIKAARASGAHVMEVREVEEVNYENISSKLSQVEKGANQ